MKAKLIKPPPLREQLKAIASQPTLKHSPFSDLASANTAKSKKKSSKPRTTSQSKRSKRKPKSPRNPTIAELIERLAEGVELLEEIFK